MLDPETVEVGKALMEGALLQLCKWWLLFVVVSFFLYIIYGFFSIGVDSTDVSGWERSGLKLLRDNQTGIEYLSDGKGGLIKREGV